MAKHIATYPIFGTNPITGQVWNKRVGTGYIYRPEQIEAEEIRLARCGHPLRLRWRNDECRADYAQWLADRAAQSKQGGE